MDSDVLAFAQVMSVIVPSVAAFVLIALGGRVLWRMGSRTKPTALPPYDETRIERIENAVDAIAIEVERISEGQRFTVGLLSDRLPARPGDRIAELASPKRANTPH
jgi:hypothetical protein